VIECSSAEERVCWEGCLVSSSVHELLPVEFRGVDNVTSRLYIVAVSGRSCFLSVTMSCPISCTNVCLGVALKQHVFTTGDLPQTIISCAGKSWFDYRDAYGPRPVRVRDHHASYLPRSDIVPISPFVSSFLRLIRPSHSCVFFPVQSIYHNARYFIPHPLTHPPVFFFSIRLHVPRSEDLEDSLSEMFIRRRQVDRRGRHFCLR
jgi:hypothetical protein